MYLGFPPIAAAILAYSATGLRLPTADLGLLAICWELKVLESLVKSALQNVMKYAQSQHRAYENIWMDIKSLSLGNNG